MSRLAPWQRPVSYAAVGATQAEDLLQYPPAGFRPVERRARIGHGEARFDFACVTALTWGIQKNSGFRVELLEGPPPGQMAAYTPVEFDDEGNPISAALSTEEKAFAPDGTPLLAAGDTAQLVTGSGPFQVSAPVRVVYVLDERKRKGFAYGTIAGHPVNGEESFVIEFRDDDSVWITVRTFSRPASRWWWLAYPVLRVTQEVIMRRYLVALSGPIPASDDEASQGPTPA